MSLWCSDLTLTDRNNLGEGGNKYLPTKNELVLSA